MLSITTRDDESVCVESLTYLLSEEGGAGTIQPWEGRVPLNTNKDNNRRDPITATTILPTVAVLSSWNVDEIVPV